MHYWWSVPACILMYSIYARLAFINNTFKSNWAFILLSIIGALPLWSFVSRASKNLVFDGLLYDFLIVTSYTITMVLLTNSKFAWYNTVGVLLMICGLLLVKI